MRQVSFPPSGSMEGSSNNMSFSYRTSAHEFIIPEDYSSVDESPLQSVNWFQEHLNLSNGYIANVIRVREDIFRDWKDQHSTLTSTQIESLKVFSSTLIHLLSFLNFRQDLMQNILDAPSESFRHEPTALTPPWLGTSLKTYIESQGINGVKEVDCWVQSIRWSDSF